MLVRPRCEIAGESPSRHVREGCKSVVPVAVPHMSLDRTSYIDKTLCVLLGFSTCMMCPSFASGCLYYDVPFHSASLTSRTVVIHTLVMGNSMRNSGKEGKRRTGHLCVWWSYLRVGDLVPRL